VVSKSMDEGSIPSRHATGSCRRLHSSFASTRSGCDSLRVHNGRVAQRESSRFAPERWGFDSSHVHLASPCPGPDALGMRVRGGCDSRDWLYASSSGEQRSLVTIAGADRHRGEALCGCGCSSRRAFQALLSECNSRHPLYAIVREVRLQLAKLDVWFRLPPVAQCSPGADAGEAAGCGSSFPSCSRPVRSRSPARMTSTPSGDRGLQVRAARCDPERRLHALVLVDPGRGFLNRFDRVRLPTGALSLDRWIRFRASEAWMSRSTRDRETILLASGSGAGATNAGCEGSIPSEEAAG
jgi:hypothetical protein